MYRGPGFDEHLSDEPLVSRVAAAASRPAMQMAPRREVEPRPSAPHSRSSALRTTPDGHFYEDDPYEMYSARPRPVSSMRAIAREYGAEAPLPPGLKRLHAQDGYNSSATSASLRSDVSSRTAPINSPSFGSERRLGVSGDSRSQLGIYNTQRRGMTSFRDHEPAYGGFSDMNRRMGPSAQIPPANVYSTRPGSSFTRF